MTDIHFVSHRQPKPSKKTKDKPAARCNTVCNNRQEKNITYWNYGGIETDYQHRFQNERKRLGFSDQEIEQAIDEAGFDGAMKDVMEKDHTANASLRLKSGERPVFLLHNTDQYKSIGCLEQAAHGIYIGVDWEIPRKQLTKQLTLPFNNNKNEESDATKEI